MWYTKGRMHQPHFNPTLALSAFQPHARHKNECISFPIGDELQRIQEGFYEMANFPGVVGAIDCTHVPILRLPGNMAELFQNRKVIFSINTQVVGDHNMIIRNIVAKWPWSTHDSRIFDNSRLSAHPIHNPVNGYLLGDSGYGCQTYLLTPVLNPQLRSGQNYNFAHSATRTSVERLFRVLKRRFPRLANGLRISLRYTLITIVAVFLFYTISLGKTIFLRYQRRTPFLTFKLILCLKEMEMLQGMLWEEQ